MSGVIKFDDDRAAGARAMTFASASLGGPPAPPALVVDPDVTALRLQVSTLDQQLRQRDAEIEQLKRDVDASFVDGAAQGRQAGLEAADRRTADSLAALQAGIAQATGEFAGRMSGLEQLAVRLAHEGLGRIIEDPGAYVDLLTSTVRRHLERLELQAVVNVQVSRADFSDPAALEALAAGVGRPDLEIHASGELAAGDCRIKLRLGTLEVGVAHQWSRLGEALRGLTEPGDPA